MEGKERNARGIRLHFSSPNLGREAGNLKDRGRWKGASGTSEQAAKLPSSPLRVNKKDGRGKGRRGQGEEEAEKAREAEARE